MSLNNTQLVNHGIQNENSDIRAHVGVLAQRLYIYKTEAGRQVIANSNYRKAPVYTGKIQTATGYLVPVEDIPGLQSIPIPRPIFEASGIAEHPEQGYHRQKGKSALHIVVEMLKAGLVPVTLQITEVNDKKMQIGGEDIRVKADIRIQVKCDYRAGRGHERCTGNLFLQVAECNPFGIH